MNKKNLLPKLNLPKGYAIYPQDLDIRKIWTLVYYDENGKRVRKKYGINRFKTIEERLEVVRKVIDTHKKEGVIVRGEQEESTQAKIQAD